MTTNHAFTITTDTTTAAGTASGRRRSRTNRIGALLGAIGRYYRVNWQRAAAQEYEYLRLREEAVRKYSAASSGRM